MVRKQLYIEPDQDLLLKRLAARYDRSKGQIVRKAIDGLSCGQQFIAEEVDLNLWEEEMEFLRSRLKKRIKVERE